MSRIANPKGPLGLKAPNYRGTAYEGRYYKWLHAHCKCIITQRPDFQIAHTGGLSQGKGMSIKAGLDTCLPLMAQLHAHEEGNRTLFWRTVGLPDHLDFAARIYAAWQADEDPTPILAEAWARVDQDYVRTLLGEIGF